MEHLEDLVERMRVAFDLLVEASHYMPQIVLPEAGVVDVAIIPPQSEVGEDAPLVLGHPGHPEDTLCLEDATLGINYNTLTKLWHIYYYPSASYGFEIVCAELSEGVEYVILTLETQIAFQMGDVESCAEELFEELEKLGKGEDG